MELLTTRPLAGLSLLLLLGFALRYSLIDQPQWQRWTSWGLRVLGVILLIFAVCRPYWLRASDKAHILFLVDASQSVDLDAVIAASHAIRTGIASLRPGDTWTAALMGNTVRPVAGPEELAQQAEAWKSGLADDEFRSESPLGSALLHARLLFPAGAARRIVLFSDGHDTEGQLAESMQRLKRESVDVQWQPLASLQQSEAAVLAVKPSTERAFLGETVRFRVEVAANRSMTGELRLLFQGVAVQQRAIHLPDSQLHAFDFDVPVKTPGSNAWTAEFLAKEDHFPINNQVRCNVLVQGKPHLLVLHEEPSELREMQRALAQQDIELEVRGPLGLPETMDEMLQFDGIVLANLPATLLSEQQMQYLKSYVSDFGGGLFMLGSENSFGLGGYYKTPVEDVLPLTSRFEREKEKPSLAMVLVIDKSGSMQGQPIELARQAAKAAVELLSDRDMIAVVGFDGAPVVICQMTSAADRGTIQAAIDSLDAAGGTDMFPALQIAHGMLQNSTAKIRHMIVLSDGQTQSADHQSLVQEMAGMGITFSAVALGEADKPLLSNLAELGRGRYYETDRPENVPHIFTKETMQASRSAIKEDLFQTVVVGDHPMLAGYAQADLPLTTGYVMTEAKPTAQLLLAAETGDPLLATSRFGLGTGVAFTGDWSERWGGEWLSWEDCGPFWAQVLRGAVRKTDVSGMHVVSRPENDLWHVEITRTDDNGQPLSGIRWEAETVDEIGRHQKIAVHEVGLGRYALQASLRDADRVSLRIHDLDHHRLRVLSHQRGYPREYRLSQEVATELSQRRIPSIHTLCQDLPTSRTRESAAHVLYLAALASLLLGLFVRRM